MEAGFCQVGLFAAALLSLYSISDARLSAVAIDFGSESIEIALVKPGVPMAIVLNREAQRKSENLIRISKQEVQFGLQASYMRNRYPATTFGYFVDLLAKKMDNPVVKRFQRMFPQYTMVADPFDGGASFVDSEGKVYSVVELVAMQLAESMKIASKFAEEVVTDAIITVPPYFNQAERLAMKKAAELAGIHLISLMNDNTATGLNFGTFRRKEFSDKQLKVLIYDMGAWKTTATTIEYVLQEDKSKKEKVPKMTVTGVGYRRVGGLDFTVLLRDHLAQRFMQTYKAVKTPVTENLRTMSKLFVEAERIKKQFSFNPEAFVQVENLHEGEDFHLTLPRDEFEPLCEELLKTVTEPVVDALKIAKLKPEDVDFFILMGAGTRMPAVQKRLEALLPGKELSKFLNTDEAAALGAVFDAASKSKGFRTMPFIVRDFNLFPIQASFLKEISEDNGEAASITDSRRVLRRTLFDVGNSFPQKKMMTFSRHTRDFNIQLGYGPLEHLSQSQIEEFGALDLSNVSVTGVQKAYDANVVPESSTKYKGVRLHYTVDSSGVLQLINVEAIFEKAAPPEPVTEDSTLQKISRTLSNLFHGGKATEENATDIKQVLDEALKNMSDSAEAALNATNATQEAAENETMKNDSMPVNKSAEKKTSSPTIVKVPLVMKEAKVDMLTISDQWMTEKRKRLEAIDEFKRKKEEREEVQNALESFISETNVKLGEEEYSRFETGESLNAIELRFAEASEWLEEQTDKTDIEEFRNRLKDLRNVTAALFYKHHQHKERPKAIAAFKEVHNYSLFFLNGAKNYSDRDAIFTATELNTLEKLLNDSMKWFNESEALLKNTPLHVIPAVSLADFAEKIAAMEREVKYLVHKVKLYVPKVVNVTAGGNETGAENATVAGEETAATNETETATAEPLEIGSEGVTKPEQQAGETTTERPLSKKGGEPAKQEPGRTEL